MKKYEFTGEVKFHSGRTLHRIRAVISFGNVAKGDDGGWIEKEENLAHDGNAWVSDNARVCGDACVCGDARVCGDAWVSDNARVCGDAWVYGDACVCGDARVYGDACVCGDARVCGDACVYGDARVCGDAWVYGDARVCGDVCVYDNARVCGDAWVSDNNRILMVGPFGSRADTTTFCYAKGGIIQVACGCFRGTIEAFAEKVKQTHGDNIHAKNYLLAVEIAKNWICTDKAEGEDA